jgi:hypothetical protein
VLTRQCSAITFCAHAYRMNHLNIISFFRKSNSLGLADFVIIVEYTPIQLSRHCVVPIEPAARYGYTIPEPYSVVTRRNRSLAVPYLDLVS